MNEPTIETLARRLDRVEREIEGKRGRYAKAMKKPLRRSIKKPRVVKAEKIVFLDASGITRAELGEGPDGGIGLFLYDRDGNSRVSLRTLDDGSAKLSFIDNDGRLSALLAVLRDGSSRLTLTLYDKDKRVLWSAP